MKLCCSFAILVLLAFTSIAKADWKDDMKATSKLCQEETKATSEELQKFYKGGMNPADATDTVKCQIKCMMEKRGFFKDGVFDDQAYVKNMQNIPKFKDRQAEIAKMAPTCKTEKGANPCDTAFKIAMCFKNNKDTLSPDPQ